MGQTRIIAAVALRLSALLAMEYPGYAAQVLGSENPAIAACTAHFRRCVNRCDRVYESVRAIRTCRYRCDDDHLRCETPPH
jgi:hypothetical protein